MDKKQAKKITREATPLLVSYELSSVVLNIDKEGYPHALCVSLDLGVSVRVNHIPSTTGTPPKFVAQNILKAARQAIRLAVSNGLPLDNLTTGYPGGK